MEAFNMIVIPTKWINKNIFVLILGLEFYEFMFAIFILNITWYFIRICKHRRFLTVKLIHENDNIICFNWGKIYKHLIVIMKIIFQIWQLFYILTIYLRHAKFKWNEFLQTVSINFTTLSSFYDSTFFHLILNI